MLANRNSEVGVYVTVLYFIQKATNRSSWIAEAGSAAQ